MHFSSSCLKKHLDDLARSGTAHDRIVYHDDALPFDRAYDWGQFRLHALLADVLFRLDEGPMDVSVLGERELHGYSRCARESHRRRNRCLGHGNDYVRFNFIFACQLHTKILAHLIDRCAKEFAIGACEVDEFEYVELWIWGS